ncbi:MAG: Ig-like domain-containing protein [Candidatus Bathyarchaeia archaeon]|jgi:hypothetical protein
MHFKYQKAMILLIGILLLVFITPTSLVANCEKTSTFQAQYGLLNQKLYVSVPPSLYDYYSNMSHTVNTDSDYAKFVTPQAVEPIAESIQNITRNLPYSNEQFADAVLTLVHQIPYAINGPEYPVETLVNNSGDCVALSLLAASIMQAGGLAVVLIHYTGITPGHMNVGVYLPYTPVYHTAGMAPTDFVYDNKTYWTAECTPAENWKVGDQWNALANAEPNIIPLNNTEQSSPAQVSSSLNTPLLPSSITINLSQEQSSANMSQEQSSIGENPRALTISGSISPTYSGENVSIYVSNASSYDYFTTVTNDAGGYMSTWNFTSPGTYYIRTSWSGASNYAGADSETLTVFVGPESFAQFETPNYNYIYGQAIFVQAGLGAYELSPLQGVNDFLSIPLGTGVSFSYDFTILQAGHTISNVQTETITIPASEQTIRMGRNGQTKTITIPGETITTPVNVPTGLQPIMLPDDFNQTINNQFCFILQNNSGNYSLNVSGLNDIDMSNIIQGNESNIAFMNASENIKENTWYNVTERISDNGITANLYNTNGTLIENMVTPYNGTDSNETVMLITNNVDSAVILKDLTVKALNITIQPPKSNEKTTNESGSLFPYVSLSILLVATFSVAVVYVKKKRQMRQKNRNNVQPTNQI